PAEAKKLDALRDKMRSGEIDREAMRAESQTIYAAVGVDPRVAAACRFRAGSGGQSGAGAAAAGAQTQNAQLAANGTQQPQLQLGNTERGGTGQRVRPALVFVAKGKTFEPRSVTLGAGKFDYPDVVSGHGEGNNFVHVT